MSTPIELGTCARAMRDTVVAKNANMRSLWLHPQCGRVTVSVNPHGTDCGACGVEGASFLRLYVEHAALEAAMR